MRALKPRGANRSVQAGPLRPVRSSRFAQIGPPIATVRPNVVATPVARLV